MSKELIGDSGKYPDPEKDPGIKPGYSYWIENGEWFTAPTVDPEKFGKHEYNHGFGTGECSCGCFMGSESSSGPVDPFGACPDNPNPFT